MSSRTVILLALASLTSCGAPAQGTEPELRTYDAGPSSDPGRIRFTVPVQYLKRRPDLAEAVNSSPLLAVDLASFAPAAASPLDDRKAGYLRVAWTREGSIRRRTDGTWLNHYSVYNEPFLDAYGLKQRLTGNRRFGDNSFLLIEPPGHTMIVCEQFVPHVPMACTLAAEYEKGLLIELSFDPVHLPDWKKLRARAEAFVRPKVTFGEQTPLAR